MKSELQIENMTVSEKLEAMERLWESLTNSPEELPSSQWHKTILDKRLKETTKKPNRFTDFEKVKELIDKTIQ